MEKETSAGDLSELPFEDKTQTPTFANQQRLQHKRGYSQGMGASPNPHLNLFGSPLQ